MAKTFSDVMALANQVKAIDAQNFAAGDQLLAMLRSQMTAFQLAQTQYAATIADRDNMIATRNAEYAALNERNTEIGNRLTQEQIERQGLAAQLATTNQLLSDSINDATIKAQLLADAETARLNAEAAFDAEKQNLLGLISGRDQAIAIKDVTIADLNQAATEAAQAFQTQLDAIAAQLEEILSANVTEDADVREAAATGTV